MKFPPGTRVHLAEQHPDDRAEPGTITVPGTAGDPDGVTPTEQWTSTPPDEGMAVIAWHSVTGEPYCRWEYLEDLDHVL